MKKIISTLSLLLVIIASNAQVGINNSGNSPASSSMLDVSSTNKGVLLPRMTSQQRNAISSPETGLLVFDTDRQALYMFDGDGWRPFAYATDQAASLTPRYPKENIGYLGKSVAIWDDYAVVGSPSDTANGFNSGTAYIYMRENGTWKQKARLAPSNGAASDQFGYSVDIHENTVVIGAPGKTISGSVYRGRVYVFKRNGHVWQQIAGIQSNDGIAGDEFGTSVSIYGNTLAVGSPYNSTGSVYIFRKENNAWTQKAKLLPWTAGNGMHFGRSVALWGSTLVTGAPKYGNGVAFTFNNTDLAGAVWANGQRLDPDQSNFTMDFGVSVSIHENNMVIGAPFYRTPDGTAKGTAYIFKRFNNNWSKYTTIGNEGENGQCGAAVAVDGNRYYVGCPMANGQRGKVIMLHNTYYQGDMRTYFNTDSDATAEFGTSVASFGEHFIIGAPVRFPSVTFGRNP